MDREQDRFYEDEELESRGNPQQSQNEEDIDDMRYFGCDSLLHDRMFYQLSFLYSGYYPCFDCK